MMKIWSLLAASPVGSPKFGSKEGRFVGNDKVDFIGDGMYLFLKSMEESGMSLETGFSKAHI